MNLVRTLHDWQEHSNNSIPVVIKSDVARIDVEFGTGASLWIEYQDGAIRVHVYTKNNDEPFNVEINGDEITTTDDR